MAAKNIATVGGYLAKRLEDLGLKHYFAIPGDYNLVLLDELLKNENLKMISCCNELNAGYAADGYSRTFGISALVVTYSVGGLSAINAVAGAYAENLPMIVISGSPNTNSANENQFLHHTLGVVNYHYVREMFAKVTAYSVTLNDLMEVPFQIDHAIETALIERKPVYIEIACNISGLEISGPCKRAFPRRKMSDESALEDAVSSAAEFLNRATKPVLVAGVKIRSFDSIPAFRDLAEASGYAVATMPDAKGFFPGDHAQYIGTYWGPVSSAGCGDIVESADAYLFAGPTFTDYSTTGFSALINREKLICVSPNFVRIGYKAYGNVMMSDFFEGLSKRINKNPNSLVAYERIKVDVPPPSVDVSDDTPISTRLLFGHIQSMLNEKSAVIAKTGDSWFNTMKLKLPEGCGYGIQMQYGSIGWSVGAVLGYALGPREGKRPIACIGDGSFQMTAQEVSTMIRYGVKPNIFLINNGGYTIEVEIHDGPYNEIKNWEYAKLIDVFNAGEGNGWSCKVGTAGELRDAIQKAMSHDGLCMIEVMIDRDDCNRSLLSWGSRVANCNGRKPRVM